MWDSCECPFVMRTRFPLQGVLKPIRIAGCLSDINSGQDQVQSSLVITLKLKVPNDEDEKMIMDDGYLK